MRVLLIFAVLGLFVESVLAQVVSCPGKCQNSGSTSCRTMGCAYCGKSCDRRLEELESVEGGDRDLLAGGTACVPALERKNIEAAMNIDLSKYCNGAPGCSIFARAEPVSL